MKCTVLGWMRMSGTAKASGNAYDFARLNILKPVEPATREKSKIVGDGFEQAFVNLRVGCEGQFKGLKFPAEVELSLDHEMGPGGRMDVVCTGFVRPPSLKTA